MCLATGFCLGQFHEFFFGDFDEFHVLGVPWEPDEFLQKSLEVPHPMDKSAALPTELRFAVLQMARLEVSEIARRGVEFFQYWNRRARELIPEEAKLRQSMDVEVSNVVRSKRLVLFVETLQFYNYPDKEVLEELTGMLPLKFTPALLTEQDLAAQAALPRPLVEKGIVEVQVMPRLIPRSGNRP